MFVLGVVPLKSLAKLSINGYVHAHVLGSEPG